MGLTQRAVDVAKYDPDGQPQQIMYDDHRDAPPGFGVRLNPGGSKSYVLRYRDPNGRPRMLTLGRVGPLKLKDARMQASRAYLTARDGEDPRKETNGGRAAELVTVSDLLDAYLERYAKRHRRSWSEDARRIESRLRPAIGSHHLADVGRVDVHELHDRIAADAKVEANRTIELLRGAWNWGLEMELVEVPNPATAGRHRRYTWKARERARERVLTRKEMGRVIAAINAEPNPWARGAMWLGVTTALRKTDILRRRWSDVNPADRTWSFTTSKDQEPRTYPLSGLAWSKLEAIPRQQGAPWIICSTRAGKRLKSIKKPWAAVREAAGLDGDDGVVFHDLRRTLASWLASDGVSDRIIKAILGHRDPSATGVYARVSLDAVRGALDRYAELVTVAMPRHRDL